MVRSPRMPRPRSVTVGDTRLQGPIRNQRCPACGNADSIFRETLTLEYTVHDALEDHAIGVPPWWRILFPPRRTRMRCGKCNCLFPARWATWARLLAWGALGAALAITAPIAYAHRAVLWSRAVDWCQHNPYVALAIAAVTLTAAFTILLVIAYPTRHNPAP